MDPTTVNIIISTRTVTIITLTAIGILTMKGHRYQWATIKCLQVVPLACILAVDKEAQVPSRKSVPGVVFILKLATNALGATIVGSSIETTVPRKTTMAEARRAPWQPEVPQTHPWVLMIGLHTLEATTILAGTNHTHCLDLQITLMMDTRPIDIMLARRQAHLIPCHDSSTAHTPHPRQALTRLNRRLPALRCHLPIRMQRNQP